MNLVVPKLTHVRFEGATVRLETKEGTKGTVELVFAMGIIDLTPGCLPTNTQVFLVGFCCRLLWSALEVLTEVGFKVLPSKLSHPTHT